MTTAVAIGEVASLTHELRDDPMERASLVAKAFLASAKSTEVLGSPRDHVGRKLDHHPAGTLRPDLDVQKTSWVGLFLGGRFSISDLLPRSFTHAFFQSLPSVFAEPGIFRPDWT